MKRNLKNQPIDRSFPPCRVCDNRLGLEVVAITGALPPKLALKELRRHRLSMRDLRVHQEHLQREHLIGAPVSPENLWDAVQHERQQYVRLQLLAETMGAYGEARLCVRGRVELIELQAEIAGYIKPPSVNILNQQVNNAPPTLSAAELIKEINQAPAPFKKLLAEALASRQVSPESQVTAAFPPQHGPEKKAADTAAISETDIAAVSPATSTEEEIQ